MRLSIPTVQAFWEEVEKIAEAIRVDQLQPGDIILTSMDKRKIHASKFDQAVEDIYRKFSPRLQGRYTHSAIYTGNGDIIEAVDTGVRRSNVQRLTKGKSYVVVRPKVHETKRLKAVEYAKRQLGKDYSDPDLLRAAGNLVVPERLAKGGKGKVQKKSYTCSGLISSAYEEAGAPLGTQTTARGASSADLLVAKKTKVMKQHVRPEHRKFKMPVSRIQKRYAKRLGMKVPFLSRVGRAVLLSAPFVTAGAGVGAGARIVRRRKRGPKPPTQPKLPISAGRISQPPTKVGRPASSPSPLKALRVR